MPQAAQLVIMHQSTVWASAARSHAALEGDAQRVAQGKERQKRDKRLEILVARSSLTKASLYTEGFPERFI